VSEEVLANQSRANTSAHARTLRSRRRSGFSPAGAAAKRTRPGDARRRGAPPSGPAATSRARRAAPPDPPPAFRRPPPRGRAAMRPRPAGTGTVPRRTCGTRRPGPGCRRAAGASHSPAAPANASPRASIYSSSSGVRAGRERPGFGDLRQQQQRGGGSEPDQPQYTDAWVATSADTLPASAAFRLNAISCSASAWALRFSSPRCCVARHRAPMPSTDRRSRR